MIPKRLLALTFLAALAVMHPCTLHAQWVQLDESYSGANRCLATMGSYLFAGGNGVWLSTDSGTSWTPIGLQDSGTVNALAVIGTNLFASTNNSGVFLSTNNGTSWTSVNRDLPNGTFVNALAVIGTTLFAGADDDGVLSSTNNGTSWAAINALYGTSVSALAVSGTNLFAGSYTGSLFLTTNNGTSWTAANDSLLNADITALAVSGTVPFVGMYGKGVFRSGNNGASWTAVNTGLTSPYILSLAVNSTNLFAGTYDGFFLSTDNGTSWTADGLPNRVVYSLAVSNSYVFAGTDSNVWRLPLPELDTSLYTLGVNGTINDTVAFGSVPVGNTALREVSPYNAGKEPLIIQPVEEPGNDFATSDLSGSETLDSGETFTFEAFFEPTDTGYHAATITLISQAKIVNVVLTGTGYDAGDVKNSSALQFELSSYPNPFSQSTQITFTSQTAGYAEVSIVNLLGVEVAKLFSGELGAGGHNFTWSNPTGLPDGTYECLVRMNGQMETLPILLMKN